eukprot:10299867-Prorocentrum_lima.AAC.1
MVSGPSQEPGCLDMMLTPFVNYVGGPDDALAHRVRHCPAVQSIREQWLSPKQLEKVWQCPLLRA